jgi:branched-chain amino acid aminotransferase
MEQQYPPGTAYMDGEYIAIKDAKISVLDWGFLRSDATYDVVHVWKGRFFRLDKHLDRFERSVAKLRMTLPYDREEMTEIFRNLVRRSGLEDAYVEMILTRGVSPTFSRDPRDAVNRFIAFAIPFGWIANEEQRKRGLDIAVSSIPRINPESVDPTVKNYHWMDLVAGIYEAYDRGSENVVLVDGVGNITEGPGFNLFVVKNGVAATPATGVLEGITRQSALDICAELQIRTETRAVAITELEAADEVFITSTAGGIMPVTKVNGRAIADGRPGPMTGRIAETYWLKHADPAWTTPVEEGS